MRLLIDTNVLVSYLLYPNSASAVTRLMRRVEQGEFALVFPDGVTEELHRNVAAKEFLACRIASRSVDELLEIMEHFAVVAADADGESPVRSRDPADDFIIAAGRSGDADFIVTGDRDLLDERDRIPRPLIVTAAELLLLLEVNYDK